MNPPLIGAFGAIATLCAAMLAHALRYAYQQGRTDNRIAVLESVQKDLGGLREVVAALGATVESFGKITDRLDRAVESLSARVALRRAGEDL